MKNLIFILISFLTLKSVYGQIKIDSNIVKSDFGGSLVSLDLKLNDVRKSVSSSDDIGYLCNEKNKKQFRPYFRFYISFCNGDVFYNNRKYKTKVAILDSVFVSNDVLNITMISIKNKNKLLIKISNDKENNVQVLIIEKYKNGKTKKYFSKNCKIKKISYKDHTIKK
jgi:hypothetical protein